MILYHAANTSARPLFIVLAVVVGLCAVPFAMGYAALGVGTLINKLFAGEDEYVIDADNAWVAAVIVTGAIEVVAIIFFLTTYAKWR